MPALRQAETTVPAIPPGRLAQPVLERERRVPAERRPDVPSVEPQLAREPVDLLGTSCHPPGDAQPRCRHRDQAGTNIKRDRHQPDQFRDTGVVIVGNMKGFTRGCRIDGTPDERVGEIVDKDQAATCVDGAER
jgi:hypothetical protein